MSKELEKSVIFVDFFDTIMHRHVHPLAVMKKVSELEVIGGGTRKYMEIGCQYPDKRLIGILTKYKKLGKRIYIVSDFDMGKAYYVDFLTAKNVDVNLFDDIFVSCDCGCSKENGNLYPYVLKKLEIEAKDVLMIGDNKKVDGTNANKWGIDSWIIPHYGIKLLSQLKRVIKYDYSKSAAETIRRDLYTYGSPYAEYALLLYLTVRELYRDLNARQQRTVVFLAREGHFLRRAFEVYQHGIVDEEKRIETDYLKISRRAAQSLHPQDLKKLEEQEISIYDLLLAHGFSNEKAEMLAKEFGLTMEELCQVRPLGKSPTYLKLLARKDFCKIILERQEENQAAAKKYFSGFDKGETVNVVDIGWRGSMQDTISEILGKHTFGYYVGLNDSDRNLRERKGLLFCSCPLQGKVTPFSQVLKANIQLYEQIAAAPHGSTVGYSLRNGEAVVEEDWVENEKQLYCKQIESLQKEILLNIAGLSVWNEAQGYTKLLKLCAKTVLRSGMFANKERRDFLSYLDSGFVWNFNKQTKGLQYDSKRVKIGKDFLLHPDRYARYFVKIQRMMSHKGRMANALYYPLGVLLYFYVWGVCVLRYRCIGK